MMSGIKKGLNGPTIFKWPWRTESTLTTGLLGDVAPEIELSDYRPVPSFGSESPTALLNGESVNVEAIADLDLFFERVYNYYCEKGLWCIITKWIFELLTLGFVIVFSAFFLLVVDWKGLSNAKCGINAVGSGIKPCDLANEAIHQHPLVPFTFVKGIIVGYLGILSIYWVFCFLKFFAQLKNTLETRQFYYNSLNITDHEVQTTPWESILEKVVQVQSFHQLCVVKDLSAHDVIMRVMRKENYLIGMINKSVLSFPIPKWVPGAGPTIKSRYVGREHRLVLTKYLEWVLNWCILQSMFDRNFCVRRDFISNPSALRKRLVTSGLVMLLLSPFLVIFTLVRLFLKYAEEFYHHPSLVSSRRWSTLSKWIFREFNEVEHLFRHRVNNSVEHAAGYLKQFPAPIVNVVAKFISFVAGGFAAVLIIIAFLEESLLEGHIFGRNLFWYAAVFGTVTAISRAAISDELQVLDPEGAMSLVVQHTHYMPKRWRGKENIDKVRKEFETLFQYTVMLFLEEIVSIFVTPYLLVFVLTKRVDNILQFISDFTVTVEGVGDVCSLSVFDFERHGNRNYGSPYNAPCDRRSSQGKMEKSFLSFQTSYPAWQPNSQGKQFLSNLQRFREQQLQQHEAHLAYPPTLSRQPSPNSRPQGEVNSFVSRDILLNRGGLFTRTGPHLNSLRSITTNQKSPPYLLDWYYTSHRTPGVDNIEGVYRGPTVTQEPLNDHEISPSDVLGDIKPCEGKWGFSVQDRTRSPLEASTSRPFFRESFHNDAGQPQRFAQSHWWARSKMKASGPEASFLEPPNFVYRNTAHHYDNFSERSEEEHNEEELDWRDPHMGGQLDWRNSNFLARTTYIDGSVNDELNIHPPFSDICDTPLKNLHVRTQPISEESP
ncbi:autophagy-related protein 9-like [Aristolochia californica]|uniref:autophagy-related protein 9-like n=1 Tax=Aristolochia californica TaxID=171875 RepID=UPI0035E322F2